MTVSFSRMRMPGIESITSSTNASRNSIARKVDACRLVRAIIGTISSSAMRAVNAQRSCADYAPRKPSSTTTYEPRPRAKNSTVRRRGHTTP